MSGNSKVLVIGVLAAIAIIACGVFFFSKQGSVGSSKVNQDLLIRSDSQTIKAPNEKAVLVEFGDFQCPGCGTYHILVKKLLVDHKDNLTFVYRDFPLNIHKNAGPAAYAAEAAGLQGKYWQMHDMIFESQNKWSTSTEAESIFLEYAKALGLDLAKFKADAASDAIKQKVARDTADGLALGVDSTPTFYLNGEKLNNLPSSYENFSTLIKAAILKQEAEVDSEEAYHAHYDLKVYLNGKMVDTSVSKFQSTEELELDEGTHLHDGIGNVIHLHKKNVPLSQFFNSIKLSIPENTSGRTLKVFVNGKQNNDLLNYVPQDLDRILVSYGSESEKTLEVQIGSVTDQACIYSEKCPERGTPPAEACVGGLGSGCED